MENPKEIIYKCTKYSSNTVCIECADKFFVSNGACAPIEPKDNCSKYSRTASSTKCIECSKDFYLSSNSCVERSKGDIKSCKTYRIDKDACEVCNSGYVGKGSLSNGYTECAKKLSNCITHSISTNDDV